MDQRNWHQGPAPRSPASPSPGAPPGQTEMSGSCWLGADSASAVTPESASAGDVDFKLSLRRKKKSTGTTKRGSGLGRRPPESRPPRAPAAWPHGGSQRRRPVPVAEEDSARDPGCGRRRGRWSHRACPRGSQKRGASTEVEGSASGGRGQMSLSEPAAPPCGRPGRGGTRAYSASLTAGLWEPAGGRRPGWRRSCPRIAQSVLGPGHGLAFCGPVLPPGLARAPGLGHSRCWAEVGQARLVREVGHSCLTGQLDLTPALPRTLVAEAPFFSMLIPAPATPLCPEAHRHNSPRPGST